MAGHWYDCGVFSLLAGNTDRSEQCFKEAVALDQTCVSAYVCSVSMTSSPFSIRFSIFIIAAALLPSLSVFDLSMRELCFMHLHI